MVKTIDFSYAYISALAKMFSYLFFISCTINGKLWIKFIKHSTAFYCFFPYCTVKILVSRHRYQYWCHWSPWYLQRLHSNKGQHGKSAQPCSRRNGLPGYHFPEGRKESLALPMAILSAWKNSPQAFADPWRLASRWVQIDRGSGTRTVTTELLHAGQQHRAPKTGSGK